jgi:DNA-binding response OmpR family regulator
MTVATSGLRLLFVEDDPDSREVFTRFLTIGGHEVRCAGDVREAMELADAHGCDVLIADVGLLDGTGLELMQRMQARNHRVRGIALTGRTSEADRRDCAAAGFSQFLRKPVSFGALMAAVEGVRCDLRG